MGERRQQWYLELHLLPAEEGAQGAGALLEVGVRGLRVEVAQILARVEPIARRIHVGRWCHRAQSLEGRTERRRTKKNEKEEAASARRVV